MARRALLLMALILLAVIPAHPAYAGDYVIGPRDVLKITVWGHQDLSQNYNVSTEGSLKFPLLGNVRAAGFTTGELAQTLTRLLEKDYLVNPQVLVDVVEYRSKKVVVLGEVGKPGGYPLTGETTILDIISQAGGVGKEAGKHLLLVRPLRRLASAGQAVPAGNTIKRLNIEKIQLADAVENVAVEDGDTLYFPAKANSFFVLGEVGKPGVYPLGEDMTVLEAVIVAGGFTGRAQPAGTKVIRKLADGTQDTLSVDLSGNVPAERRTKISDGDTVLVPRGNAYFIFGEVKKPGEFQLEKDVTILEAISAAGGFTDKASPGRTKIIRTTAKGQQTVEVDMNDIIKRGRRDKSIPLKENDVIVVPESFF